MALTSPPQSAPSLSPILPLIAITRRRPSPSIPAAAVVLIAAHSPVSPTLHCSFELEKVKKKGARDSRIEAKVKADYAAFEERVRRTVYIDNLSPQVNESILKSAFDQFGNVQKVEFIPNYAEDMPRCALVEMDSPELAKELVQAMNNQPFMVFGMPRPVRVCAAEMEMFEDRPQKPGTKITCQWLEPQNPDFTIAKKLEELTRRHAAEASFLHQYQLEEEEKLAKQQAETLEANYKKYELIEKVLKDGTAKRLGHRYGINEFNA
ncbi:hypothetical protein RHGRI_027776 [Rhododendron griersonianum]|uniref:RRM domain-containing protein n=1 Tax=Rhododendron griersonianum TaxID=479676 RepID=A0AAV6J1R3_9ERIC|nr:hypothetical protein RHGRI_027776 [Rhododendron griersonianum]KAG5533703.1 hypothetical protein RHGRI_027776 [Rhododendron griersonianum]